MEQMIAINYMSSSIAECSMYISFYTKLNFVKKLIYIVSETDNYVPLQRFLQWYNTLVTIQQYCDSWCKT